MIGWIAAAAMTFNLVCTGTNETIGGGKVENEATADTYRVDLASMQYCEENCTVLRTIAEVQDGILVLEKRTKNDGDEITTDDFVIDRVTGNFTHMYKSRGSRMFGNYTSYTKGKCESQPFTGFPKPATKF